MNKKLDVYREIAAKHSKKPISSEADVDDFYGKLPDNFTPDRIRFILTDLTNALDTHIHSDELVDQGYPMPTTMTAENEESIVNFMIPVPEHIGLQEFLEGWTIMKIAKVIFEKVGPINQLIGYGESHY